MTSLALPAALATAGLLNTAEAAYASLGPDTTTTTEYGQQERPIGDPAFTQGPERPCPPHGNITMTDYGGDCCPPFNNQTMSDYGGHCCPPFNNQTMSDYGGHCCPPINNQTMADYGHCCPPFNNITIPDYGHCRDHEHHEHGPHNKPDYVSLQRHG
ncbi:hypothetical protein [Streptomyces sp. NPDC000410]|uniref:hypothetical protein n=1 Tax=Streptomyces sp. NPDC000410 TaxID=3154254 RepID=UPI00331F4595